MLRVFLAASMALLLGCSAGGWPASSGARDPAAEAQQRCLRDGGWWRPDVGTGYCERV